MTAPNPTTPTCPTCRRENTMVAADGMALCFDCRHEWNPRAVTALPGPPLAPAPIPPGLPATIGPNAAGAAPGALGSESVPFDVERRTDGTDSPPDATPAPADDPFAEGRKIAAEATALADAEMVAEIENIIDESNASADEMLAAMLGGVATLEGGQIGVVLGFPDDDHVTIELRNGEIVNVDYGDVESIVMAERSPVAASVDVDDDTAGAIAQADMTIAGLILKAGVATVRGVGDTAELGTPPEGYLPADADMFPIVERGAATAAALLIMVCQVDTDALLARIATWEANANRGDIQQEETGDAE